MTSLIIGAGEIGIALHNILKNHYPTKIRGRVQDFESDVFDILHIAFPYDENFAHEVKKYQALYSPKYTIIHSTTPVGTCRQLNSIHSPVIGQHPFLEEGIRTFPKMIGGNNASEVADYFRRVGIKVVLFDTQETTEAAKLFLTEYYRVCIEFAQRVKNYCDANDLSFSDVYRVPNMVYNNGYSKMGYQEFIRPILEPIMTEIGGHCVGPNAKLIKLTE